MTTLRERIVTAHVSALMEMGATTRLRAESLGWMEEAFLLFALRLASQHGTLAADILASADPDDLAVADEMLRRTLDVAE